MSMKCYIGGTGVTNKWNYGDGLGLIKKTRKARTQVALEAVLGVRKGRWEDVIGP